MTTPLDRFDEQRARERRTRADAEAFASALAAALKPAIVEAVRDAVPAPAQPDMVALAEAVVGRLSIPAPQVRVDAPRPDLSPIVEALSEAVARPATLDRSALEEIVSRIPRSVGGVAGPSKVGLRAVDGSEIDPATNQRLQAVVDAINEMTVNVDVGTVQLDPNESNYVSPKSSQHVEQGIAFSGGQMHTTTNTASWSLANPAASGVLVVLGRVRAWTDANETLEMSFTEDATNSGDLRTPQNADLGSVNAAAAELRSGVGVLSGGTAWSAMPLLTRRAPYEWEGEIHLPPGKSLSVSMTGISALSSTTMSVSGEWAEVPI